MLDGRNRVVPVLERPRASRSSLHGVSARLLRLPTLVLLCSLLLTPVLSLGILEPLSRDEARGRDRVTLPELLVRVLLMLVA